MSIRNYNPGRNRRGRVSVAAERFLYTSLFLSMVLQIVFLYQHNARYILASAILASIFSISHAQLAYAKRYFWSYLSFTLVMSFAIEKISLATSWPFGDVTYHHLGAEISGVPLLVLVFWLASIHPLLIMARKIAPNWVLLSGAGVITGYALFFDQLLTANGYKTWKFFSAHIPFQTHIPLDNVIGWLFVGVVVFGLANLILPKERRKISAGIASVDIFLVWTWLYNVIANIFFFEKPGTALVGGIFFGVLLFSYLSKRYLGSPE
jgi:putative membrane protein